MFILVHHTYIGTPEGGVIVFELEECEVDGEGLIQLFP